MMSLTPPPLHPAVDLASVCTPEMMAPILSNAEVQQRLLPFLPSGESLPQSGQEIHNTLSSPQFQQVRNREATQGLPHGSPSATLTPVPLILF